MTIQLAPVRRAYVSPEPSVRNKENIKREGALHRPNVDGIQICKCADGLTDMQIFK
jgi:hypothetical protein